MMSMKSLTELNVLLNISQNLLNSMPFMCENSATNEPKVIDIYVLCVSIIDNS